MGIPEAASGASADAPGVGLEKMSIKKKLKRVKDRAKEGSNRT